MELTNNQWQQISKYLLPANMSASKRGRPPLDKREVLNAILWVLVKGARWKEMPNCYPQYQTCRNYFYEWSKAGAMEQVLKVLAENPIDKEISLKTLEGSDGHISKKKLSVVAKSIESHQVIQAC